MLPGIGGAPAATVFSAVFLVVACGGRSPEVSTRATANEGHAPGLLIAESRRGR
jgi:hypothetical protein